MASNSHFGVANQQFALLQPHLMVEAFFSQKNDNGFRQDLQTLVANFINTGPYRAAQQQFDQVDTPTVFAIGCSLDYNLQNP